MKRFYKIYIFWIFLLTITGGFLNSIGILYFGEAISHYSGNLSKIAIEYQLHHYEHTLKILGLFISFFMGCVLAGFFTKGRAFDLQKRYGCILIGISCFLSFGYFFLIRLRFFPYFLPFCLGVQNGMFISYKGVIVRTTHISGNLTDAGVYLGKHLRGEKQDAWKMFFYLYNIFSFFLGNFWGAEEFIKRGESCLLIAAVLYFIIGSFYFILRELHQQIKVNGLS